MTIEQIQAILRSTEQTLRLLLASPKYQHLEQSEYFHTNNDLTLGDAVQAVLEVQVAITSLISEGYIAHMEES